MAVDGRRAGVLRAGAHRDDPERHRAGGAAAGQRAVERDLVGDARDRRVDRRPGDRARRPRTSRSSSTRCRSSRRRSFIAQTRYDATPAAGAAAEGLLALTGITDLVEGVRYVRQRIARRRADVRQGRLGPRRRRAAAADDLRPAGLSAGRRHGGRHRRAVRRARHRRRARTDRAALDPRPAAATLRRAIGPAYFMVGVFYVALAWAPTLCARRAVRAAARTSADRSCGCSARCCCRWRCPIAFAAASSPPSSRSSR